MRIRPFAIQMGTKQSRLRRKPPSELLGWRERRTDDKPSSEKEVEGATHAVGQAATPSPGITILRVHAYYYWCLLLATLVALWEEYFFEESNVVC